MNIKAFFHSPTYTLSYVVWDEQTQDTVIIDPVLDYDPASSQTTTKAIEELLTFIQQKELRPRAILETHAHADHLSGSQLLKKHFNAPVIIGERIAQVQEIFKGIFDLPTSFATDGSQFDILVADEEVFQAGSLTIRSIATPGHTPACVSYLIGDALFSGDSLFMPDYGTGRADFPGGSASDLFDSIHRKLYSLPDQTRVFVGHDYQPNNRELAFETSIGESKRENIHIRSETTLEGFVEFRQSRDATLASPRLLFPSVQVNVDAGRLPGENASGKRHLRIPLNLFHPTDDLGNPQ